MDGTLIESLIDFQSIRAELGIPPGEGILEAISKMPPGDAALANQILLSCELAAASKARLLPGAIEILKKINSCKLKTALLTRNSKEPMELVLEKFFTEGLSFDITWSRENGPIKPEPDGIVSACTKLGVSPDRTCCVGDYYYDIVAANAAGATSVLLDPESKSDFADQANYVISDLCQLTKILGI